MARPTWNVSFYQVGRCTPCRTRHTFTWSSAPWRLGGVGRKLIWSQTVEYVCVCAQPDGNDFCRSPWSRHHWFYLILCVCVLSTSSFSSSLPFHLALELLLSQDRFNRQKKWERLEETGVGIGTAKRKDGKVDFFFGDGGRKEGRRGNQTVETTNCVRQSEFSRLLGGVSGDSKPNSKYSWNFPREQDAIV